MGQILTPTKLDARAYSTFDAAHYLTDNGGDFGSWRQLAGPVSKMNDQYSSLFQFNLSDAQQYLGGLEFPITGENTPPGKWPPLFLAECIVILTTR